MSFDEWSNNKKKKKTSSFEEWSNAERGITKKQEEEDEKKRQAYLSRQHDNDIAPVREDRTWFKESEGNWWQTILGSKTDVDEHVTGGLLGFGEKIVDGFAMLGATMAQGKLMESASTEMYTNAMLGKEDGNVLDRYEAIKEDVKKDTSEFVAKDLYDEEAIAKAIISDPARKIGIDSEKHSVFGEKSDDLATSAGQLAGQIGISMIPGVGQVGGTVAMGVSTLGSEAESALQNDATFEEAMLSGTISATAEILTEKLGGVKFGGKTWTDAAFGKLSSKVTSKFAKYLLSAGKIGADASAEAVEEVVSGYVSAWGQTLTYMDDKEIEELFTKEDALESAIGGFVLGGGYSVGEAAVTGRDPVSGLNKNEQAVVDKVVEDTVAKLEENGEKLTNKDKAEIRESVVDQMEHGRIDIDTIESVLGGDAYKAYKDTVDSEEALKTELGELRKMKASDMNDLQTSRMNELKGMDLDDTTKRDSLRKRLDETLSPMLKDSKLSESYRERERRGQAFEADLSKYTGKQRESVERAIKSGVLNNTYRSHQLVDTLSRIEAEKGIVFDYVNNAKLKESGFAVEGKTVNGFANKSKGTVTLNVQSAKAWQSTVGHEIGHVLKGGVDAKVYNDLQQALYEYAESKGELESRRAYLTEMYKGMDADIDEELTCDLLGDYLFTDKAFINKLTGNRTLFQKIYDEVKYLCKVATGKELTEIEKVKAEFDKVWKEYSNNTEAVSDSDDSGEADIDYSISVTDTETLDSLNKQVAKGEYDAETNPDGGYYVTYKSMSFWGYDEDGNAILRSPMAEYVDGELSNAYLIPKDKSKLNWYQATETIDEGTGLPSGLLVKTKVDGKKSFSYLPASENQHLINEDWSNLYFNLRKKVQKNGKWVNSDVPARYNPYEHSSNSMLNDQFSAAYLRDNLVTVKMYVPISEDNGAYRAKWSKDPTGWSDWKSGIVAGKIGKQKDLQRRVYLSRYAAPIEIVPDSEVAQAYKGYLEGTDVAIPDNVVSPNLLNELKKAGVPIEESGKVQYSISPETEGKTLYTGSPNTNIQQFKVGGVEGSRQSGDRYGRGVYLTTNENTAKGYAGDSGKVYEINADNLNIFNLNDSITDGMKATLQRELNGKDKQFRNSVLRNFRSEKAFTDFESAEQFFDEQRKLWKEEDGYYAANKPEIKSANDKTGEAVIEYTDFANIENAIGNLTGNELYDALKSISTDDFASFITGHGFDGISFDEDADNQQYVIYRNEDRLNILNNDIAPTPDVQYSLSPETDADYMSAVERGDTETAQKMVDEAAKNAGYTRKLYHGTASKFNVFGFGRTGIFTTDNFDMAKTYGNNVMSLYGKEGAKVLTIDAKESPHWAIEVSKDILDFSEYPLMRGKERYSTNDISLIAFREGYDVVVIDNVYDNYGAVSDNKENGLGTDVVYKDPNQVKSSAAVTYDDNGNVIPLSQRFNTENDDIRFSLSDSDGNQLSREQQEYFKDSKAMDENGNLLVMYHGSQNLGFTVFDPNASDDNKSFFFSDKPSVAASYSNTEDEIAPYEGEKSSGLYKTYLNLKNPYVVDARGSKWNNVVEFTKGDEFLSDIGSYMGIIRTMDSSLGIEDFLDSVRGDLVGATDYAIDELFIDEDTEESHFTAEEQRDLRELAERINNAYMEWDEDAHIDEDGESTDFESYVRQNYTSKTTRQIANEAYKNGYDGVIFKNIVDVGKFANMAQQNYDTSTVAVAFDSSQIKSVDNSNPTDDPDIRHSLSKEGEEYAPVGNYSTPFRELALDGDIAPVGENVARTTETATTKNAKGYLPVTEEEADALSKARFETITDADAPPEMYRDYDSMPDTTAIDDKTLKNIGKSLRETLSLNPQETKAIQEIVQEYSTSETPNADSLFETIKEKFGEKVWGIKNEEIADVKRYLRTIKVNVSPKIKSDIADYSDFRKKSIGGKLGISKDGLPVDTAYMELVELYPAFFSDDIWNETDQLLRMVEVANLDAYDYDSYQLDDATIQEAVNIISREVRSYKNNLTRTVAEEAAREAADSVAPAKATQIMDGSRGAALLVQSLDNFPIKTVEDKLAEKLRAVEAELADNQQLRREAVVNYNKQIADLSAEYAGLKDKSTKKATNIVNRVSRIERLKASVDAEYAKRISDLEARVERLNDPKYARAMQKQAKMEADAKWAADLLGDTSTWVDKKLGLQYATNTERRNLRDIVRDANGNVDIAHADAIDDALNGQYNRDRADLNREAAQIRSKFFAMKITRAEDAYIQMLGEFRHNPDTTLTEKDISEYYEKHKRKIDTEKVDKAIELARQDYDSLFERLNAKLRENGMKEIPYRQGYFPHFTEPKQNFIQKLLNWKTQDNEIPTSIAGLTETFKPTKSWQSFDKTRHSDETDYSFKKGFDSYLDGALDWIYHMDTLQKRRAVENHIRFTHSDEGIQAKIREVYADREIDANEAQARIEHILAEAKNPLNNFVQDFTTHTNILAGKKNSLDRTVEQATNRHIYSVMTNVQNRMSANMVLANVRSALTNFIPITQSWAQVSPLRSLQATKDTIANAIKDDGMINKSTFLTNRLREVDKLYQTNWDKVLDKAGIMFEIVDSFSSQVIWRSKYNQNLANGMSENAAIKNADQFAENVMAGRSKGNEPTLFNAKNPFVKAFTMFQLEVNNQYGYLFKDVPNDLKAETNHWKLNLVKGYTTAFIGAYVYNALLEKVTGSDAALDPIGIIEELLRDLGLFGDDEEEEPAKVATNLIGNVAEELPFVGGVLGGGRIPISSAIPYGGEYGGGLSGFIEDVSEGNWGNVGKEMMNPLLNIGLPVGGNQIKKTYQGLKMFSDDHPVTGSYTDSGNLRFPVEDTPLNRVQAAIFGQYASENARDYFDNDYAPLNEKQIQEYIDVDMPIKDYWEYREGLKGLTKSEEKMDYISGLDLPTYKKNILANNVLDRKEPVDLENYEDFGSLDEFDFATKNPEKYAFAKSVGGYSAYKTYSSELYDIKADKDASGKSINGSRKEKVIDYINNLDADYYTKIILLKSEYPSDDTYNYEIVNYINSLDGLTYEDRVAVLTELGFRVTADGQIYDD